MEERKSIIIIIINIIVGVVVGVIVVVVIFYSSYNFNLKSQGGRKS